ncbi:MAG TPA: hypothetical protein ENK02_09795 [Planctomycetes bacterium]|nr:hypothetical protein [Planctomycetota bacterium]
MKLPPNPIQVLFDRSLEMQTKPSFSLFDLQVGKAENEGTSFPENASSVHFSSIHLNTVESKGFHVDGTIRKKAKFEVFFGDAMEFDSEVTTICAAKDEGLARKEDPALFPMAQNGNSSHLGSSLHREIFVFPLGVVKVPG